MKSLPFEGSKPIAGTQQQYNTLHALIKPDGECVIIFEFTDEEINEIIRTRKIVYRQLTFGNRFQPMNILTQWPGEEAPNILPEINQDPKLN